VVVRVNTPIRALKWAIVYASHITIKLVIDQYHNTQHHFMLLYQGKPTDA